MPEEITAEISNYIPLSRKFFEHHFWNEQRVYTRAEAWLDLIQLATYEDERKKVIRGQLITWNRGELPGSLRFFSERWTWGKDRVSRFLDTLSIESMIKIRTHTETDQRIITICNYNTYNPKSKKAGQQTRQKRDTDKDTYRDTDKDKVNKENTENKENNLGAKAPSVETKEEVKKIGISHYEALMKSLPSDSDIKVYWTTIRQYIGDNRPDFMKPYVDLWNIFAEWYKLSQVQEISDSRRKKFSTRIQEKSFDFLKVLEKIKEAAHLKGDNSRNWKVTLDWIIENDKNYLKIIEGQYN